MTNQIEQLEHDIQVAKQAVALGHALERLMHNRDFQTLILTGYLENEAVRLVHLKADPSMDKPHSQASILAQIDSIGALAEYFRGIRHQSAQGTKIQQEGEEVLEELRKGELE